MKAQYDGDDEITMMMNIHGDGWEI